MTIHFIVAIDQKNGMARDSHIPWELKADEDKLHKLIKDKKCIMGFGTFKSYKFKPRPCSETIVITDRETEHVNGVKFVGSFDEVADNLEQDLWVLGGGKVFAQNLDRADKLHITRIKSDYGCDVFFPEFKGKFDLENESKVIEENGDQYTFQEWSRKK